MIYLDNASTTRPLKQVIDEVVRVCEGCFGNPSSLHILGQSAKNIIVRARKAVAKELYCLDSEIFFTSGATESNNLAVLGAAKAAKRAGNRIITTTIEHPSVLAAVGQLALEGFKVEYIPPDSNGVITAQAICEAVDDSTVLVCTMQVNNETGLILPVTEIARGVKLKNKRTVVFVDGVQGFTKQQFNMKESGIDLYSFSGHKIHGIKGVGGLYIRKGTKIAPLFYGGDQQNSVRVGTENTVGIAALAVAVEQAAQTRRLRMEHFSALATYLKAKLSKLEGLRLNSISNCADHIVNFSVVGVRSEIMLHFLEEQEIYVSSGSACGNNKAKKNLSLAGFNLPIEVTDSAIRVSFSQEITTGDLDTLIDRIVQGIERFKK